MGRGFSVDFEDSEYFMCKNCRTHIALPLTPDSTADPGQIWGTFSTVINVEVGDRTRQAIRRNVSYTLSDVFCIGCSARLGFKYKRTNSDENGSVQLEL